MVYLTSYASGSEVLLITGIGLFGKLLCIRGVSMRGYIHAVRQFYTYTNGPGIVCV